LGELKAAPIVGDSLGAGGELDIHAGERLSADGILDDTANGAALLGVGDAQGQQERE
jgi:hypothetical protein